MTKIQWTEATLNPIVGCSIATPGCTNCYAMKTAWRMGHNPKTPQYHGLTEKVNGNAVWTGKLNRLLAMRTAAARLIGRDQLGRDFFPRGDAFPFSGKRIMHDADGIIDLMKAYLRVANRTKMEAV